MATAAISSSNVQALLDFLVRNPDSPVRHTMPIEVISALSLRWFDRSPSLLYALAEHVFRAGEPARAAQLLEHLLHLGRTQTYDISNARRDLRYSPVLSVAEGVERTLAHVQGQPHG